MVGDVRIVGVSSWTLLRGQLVLDGGCGGAWVAVGDEVFSLSWRGGAATLLMGWCWGGLADDAGLGREDEDCFGRGAREDGWEWLSEGGRGSMHMRSQGVKESREVEKRRVSKTSETVSAHCIMYRICPQSHHAVPSLKY